MKNLTNRVTAVLGLKAVLAMAATVFSFGFSSAAVAQETHTVMAAGVRFDPPFIFIQPGDQVSWERMPSHNVETIDSMVPEGQEKINSELGENVFVTFDTPGIIVYKCTPHWGNRMGGVIVVGEPEDAGAILDAYMANTDEEPANLPARGLLKKVRAEMEERGLM